jgi:hypothetical protein
VNKKLHGARAGEYGGWISWVMLFLVKNCFTLKASCGMNFAATLFIYNSSLKIRWWGLQDTPDKSTSLSIVL